MCDAFYGQLYCCGSALLPWIFTKKTQELSHCYSSAPHLSDPRPSYNALVFQAARLLDPPARFEASKLEALFMGEKVVTLARIVPRTCTLSHIDFTANLTLTISNIIHRDKLKGWYSKDDVAEWTEVNGNLFLNVHCYVSGPNSFSEMTAEFRYHIFPKELPLVLEAVLYGDADLFRNHQELMDAVVKSIFSFELVQVQPYGMLGTPQGCSSGCYFSRVHCKISVTIAAEYDDWSGQRSGEDKWIRICEQGKF